MTRPMARLKNKGGGGASIIVSAGRGIQHNCGKNGKLLVSADPFGECFSPSSSVYPSGRQVTISIMEGRRRRKRRTISPLLSPFSPYAS